MKTELWLAVLIRIWASILNKENKFSTTEADFVDEAGSPLPHDYTSIQRAARRSIGGAIIEALVDLGIKPEVTRWSDEYAAVMYTLANTLDSFKDGAEAIKAVRAVNKQGYRAIRTLLKRTIGRLYVGLISQGARP